MCCAIFVMCGITTLLQISNFIWHLMSHEGECVIMIQDDFASMLNVEIASSIVKKVCYEMFSNGGHTLGSGFVYIYRL